MRTTPSKTTPDADAGGPLDRAAILAATTRVLRRFGPAKTTVADVARELGVSPATIYRHFPSKAALRDAVARRWLTAAHDDLAAIADDHLGDAATRLRRWLETLFAATRAQAAEDPELFATFLVLTRDEAGVVNAHVEELTAQLARILVDGVAQGVFTAADPDATARGLFSAAARFHHPAHAAAWSRPGIDAEFNVVCELLLRSVAAAATK